MQFTSTLAALFIAATCFAQKPTTPAPQTYKLEYDSSLLRVPGAKVPIGIVSYSPTGALQTTRGFLNGKYNWTKYRIEVDSGSYGNGKITMGGSPALYKKGDSVTVRVYERKWLLGGKGALLFTGKIPYNYETSIKILTRGSFTKAPGNHVQFGIRTVYDNKMGVEKWAPASKNLQDFVLNADGSHISKKKGDLKIDNDPYKIINDQVNLIAQLGKHPTLADTLRITMDYATTYNCTVTSSGTGHNLNVTATVYDDTIIHAKLLGITVKDSIAKKTYDYIINTNGGAMFITSQGANGADGTDGYWGAPGSNGSDGVISSTTETTTNPDGTTSTSTETTQGPGSNGGDGMDGGNGTDGGNGYNGGNITVHYTAAAQPYIKLITATSIGGTGGSGGAAGRGGDGGRGGSGNPSGNSGNSGRDGIAGNDGANGVSGKVVFMQE